MTIQNWMERVEEVSPPWLLGPRSSGFAGVTLGLVYNTMAEGFALALRAPWLRENSSPDDALPRIGNERRMPRYPTETAAGYRARLLDAWNAYKFAGDESVIVSQLALAGFPNAIIDDSWTHPLREPVGYWSQFWVRWAEGTHSVTGIGPAWGSFNWGDGTLYGPVGLTPAQIRTMRAIVRKWKPVDWICRGFIFELPGTDATMGAI